MWSYSDSGGGNVDAVGERHGVVDALDRRVVELLGVSSSTTPSPSRSANAVIGSRLRHSATCSLVRYSSGSAIEWPRKR